MVDFRLDLLIEIWQIYWPSSVKRNSSNFKAKWYELPSCVKLKNKQSLKFNAGLVIERLRNFGSTSDAVARRCVLGKDT